MSEEFVSFQTASKMQIQAASEEITRHSMHGLSFLHPNMPAYVSDFTLFEGQWTGCVTTPWMPSTLISPGPGQIWPVRKVSEKIGLHLPYGEMTLTTDKLDDVPQYLSCSLMSPLSHSMSAQEDVRLTGDYTRVLLSLPVNDLSTPQLNRRVLLLGRRNCENA